MKKLICIIFSLILVLSSFSLAFCDDYLYRYDAVTGELIDDNTGTTTNYIVVNSKCKYDKANKMYVYTVSSSSSSDVSCSVLDGMVVADAVSVEEQVEGTIILYRDGKIVDSDDYNSLQKPGSYVARTSQGDKELFSFTIVNDPTGAINSYEVPNFFYIEAASFDGGNVKVAGNTVIMKEDGDYLVRYKSNSGLAYELNITIDHTFPELELVGVENGEAKGPVTLGELEPGSSIVATCNGASVSDLNGEYSKSGDYVIKYTDAAGNTSSYYFTIKVYFNVSAWIFVILAVAIVIGIFVYMGYCKKHLRVR